MISTKGIIEFMKGNQGEKIGYGNEFSIQVYDGDVLQANISYNNEESFLKIEQREDKSITIFLEKMDEDGIIDYSHGCKLLENTPVVDLFKNFSEHPKIEKALIALLQLH